VPSSIAHLTPTDLIVSSPNLDQPTLGKPTASLIATDLSTGSPDFGRPNLRPVTSRKPPTYSLTANDDRHIRRSGDDYAQALISLLPRGTAWSRDPESILIRTMIGLAQYWGFVDGRAADLLEIESDPRLTTELLSDWERNWGLPDSCLIDPPTDLMGRRKALVTKMTLLGAQSRAFFYELADELGYSIVITERAPYMCGVSRVGDTRGSDKLAPDSYRWRLGPAEMRYVWSIQVYAKKLIYFHCNSSRTGVDRLLRIGIADDLECIFNRYKPAHTKIVYDYSPYQSLDYTQPINTQYLPLGIP
jgi:uncharacterized protein YmfQ (DUF2313 family)